MAGNTIAAQATPAAFAAASAKATLHSYSALRTGGSVRQAVDALYESDESTLIDRSVDRPAAPGPSSTPATSPRDLGATSKRSRTLRELRRSQRARPPPASAGLTLPESSRGFMAANRSLLDGR